MVDWNAVVHDWLWFSGIVLNLLVAVALLLGFAYGALAYTGSV
jgi:hypothetical protein